MKKKLTTPVAEEPKKTAHEMILDTISEKSSLKQEVFANTKTLFSDLKSVLKEMSVQLSKEVVNIDKRVAVNYSENGPFQAELKIGGDVLIFYMHTNVFEFDKEHQLWKTSYVKNDEKNSFCGMINVYNFLSDSFTYNRLNDVGYLIARIFVNREFHYFVEGKRQLSFLYNDFVNAVIDKEAIRSIVESAILYCLDFDLLSPPYDSVKEVTVSEIQENANNMIMRTGKRLGFRFEADSDRIE
jgi:hypothetical protein